MCVLEEADSPTGVEDYIHMYVEREAHVRQHEAVLGVRIDNCERKIGIWGGRAGSGWENPSMRVYQKWVCRVAGRLWSG